MKKSAIILVVSFAVFAFPIAKVFGATDGTIDAVNYQAKFLERKFGTINFGLASGNVHVTDSAVTGYAWGDNVGWINLSPTYGGVANDGSGNLSGYAWGSLTGWVNFNPTNGGVSIDTNGDFHGYAWSQNFGWIVFNCLTDNSCSSSSFKVSTNWNVTGESVPPSPPPQNGSPGGVGGSGGAPLPASPPPETVPPGDTGDQENVPPSEPPPENSVEPSAPPPVEPIDDKTGTSDNPNPPNESGVPGESSSPGFDFANAVETISNFFSRGGGRFSEDVGISLKEVAVTAKQVGKIINSPTGAITTKAVAVSGAISGAAVSIGSLFAGSLTFSELGLIPLRIWGLLLAAFGLKKKMRPWGTVYDSVTKQPIDPAIVSLIDLTGKEVGRAITDLDGRFGFLPAPGTYKIVAQKTNYIFPSKKLAGQRSDLIYDDLYFGDAIEAKSGESALFRNIPMDPIGFDWNEFMKGKKDLMKFYSRRTVWTTRFSNTLFFFGLSASVLAVLFAPAPFNIGVAVFYLLILILQRLGLRPRTLGHLTEKSTGEPLSFALVKVTIPGLAKIKQAVSDMLGRYYCLVPPGEYVVSVDRKNPDESYSTVYTSSSVKVKKGIVNSDIQI